MVVDINGMSHKGRGQAGAGRYDGSLNPAHTDADIASPMITSHDQREVRANQFVSFEDEEWMLETLKERLDPGIRGIFDMTYGAVERFGRVEEPTIDGMLHPRLASCPDPIFSGIPEHDVPPIAFASMLSEEQRNGWNPDRGESFRRTRGFRDLERRLLRGRSKTRCYMMLRDALCDDMRSYVDFMNDIPDDVFEPEANRRGLSHAFESVRPIGVPDFRPTPPPVGRSVIIRHAVRARGLRETAIQLAHANGFGIRSSIRGLDTGPDPADIWRWGAGIPPIHGDNL
ncbi:hypothetical protein [Bifidobacterium sp. SO1]|uniref:hypothetical protein n=1 Tax=Bifidobacterium sp. SO1 TaxID=2809029 RepID=UPI001BDD1F7D|nr:hypothetical protein [Bifidobacterium sp. SO1]MBT1161739.1 hypothetical protein [Bifidobacterium sp. SO1]